MKLKTFKVSAAAVKKVTNPLPIPTVCPYCKGPVSRVSNSVIYRKEYGAWPFAYRCDNAACDSYVGIHPKTDIPLGTLANKETRAARKMAKSHFAPLWEIHGVDKDAAYAWLAEKMGIANVEHCHVGWFDIAQCNQVVQICITNPKGPA